MHKCSSSAFLDPPILVTRLVARKAYGTTTHSGLQRTPIVQRRSVWRTPILACTAWAMSWCRPIRAAFVDPSFAARVTVAACCPHSRLLLFCRPHYRQSLCSFRYPPPRRPLPSCRSRTTTKVLRRCKSFNRPAPGVNHHSSPTASSTDSIQLYCEICHSLSDASDICNELHRFC